MHGNLPFNLQFFASGEGAGTGDEGGTCAGGSAGATGGEGNGGEGNANTGGASGEGEGNKGEGDKGGNGNTTPTQNLDAMREQWIKEYEAQKKAEADEAEKLKKMSEQEKREYLFNREKEEFEKQRKEFQKQTLQLETQRILVEKGISGDMAQFISGETAEQVKANIDKFTAAFNKAVAAEIDARIRKGAGSIHGAGGGGRTGGNDGTDAAYESIMAKYHKK